MKLFLDGVVVASTTKSGVITPGGSNIGIARHPASAAQYFPGYIDEIRIYDRGFTDAEVTALYEATK